jgi:hypothetical protein
VVADAGERQVDGRHIGSHCCGARL